MSLIYFITGSDHTTIEKYIEAIQKKHADAFWNSFNLIVDDLKVGELTTAYYSNSMFGDRKAFLLRNIQNNSEAVLSFLEEIKASPLKDNLIILTGEGVKFNTRLGKFLKANSEIKEFELKDNLAFDLLDALSKRECKKVVHFSSNLLDREDYNPMSLLGLLISHFLLLKRVKEFEDLSASVLAQKLKQNQFRIMKLLGVCRLWRHEQIDAALKKIQILDDCIKTWQFDNKILTGMFLLKICLDK